MWPFILKNQPILSRHDLLELLHQSFLLQFNVLTVLTQYLFPSFTVIRN